MRLALHIGGRQRAAALGTAGGRAGSVDGAVDGTRTDEALAIGEPGVEVLPCPGCNRPLRTGTRRCPACGMRFLVGVQLRRAAALLGIGFGLGLMAGGSIVTAGVIAGLPEALGRAAVAETVPPSAATTSIPPGASAETVAPPEAPVVPAVARSALLQAAAVNERLADALVPLDTALAATPFDPVDAAAAIRTIAAEAAGGSDQLARLATWSRAAALASDLRSFYDELRSTARAGLANSLTNAAAYEATAEALRGTLARLPELEARLEVLLAIADSPSRAP